MTLFTTIMARNPNTNQGIGALPVITGSPSGWPPIGEKAQGQDHRRQQADARQLGDRADLARRWPCWNVAATTCAISWIEAPAQSP